MQVHDCTSLIFNPILPSQSLVSLQITTVLPCGIYTRSSSTNTNIIHIRNDPCHHFLWRAIVIDSTTINQHSLPGIAVFPKCPPFHNIMKFRSSKYHSTWVQQSYQLQTFSLFFWTRISYIKMGIPRIGQINLMRIGFIILSNHERLRRIL